MLLRTLFCTTNLLPTETAEILDSIKLKPREDECNVPLHEAFALWCIELLAEYKLFEQYQRRNIATALGKDLSIAGLELTYELKTNRELYTPQMLVVDRRYITVSGNSEFFDISSLQFVDKIDKGAMISISFNLRTLFNNKYQGLRISRESIINEYDEYVRKHVKTETSVSEPT